MLCICLKSIHFKVAMIYEQGGTKMHRKILGKWYNTCGLLKAIWNVEAIAGV